MAEQVTSAKATAKTVRIPASMMPGGLDYEYAKGRHATTAVAGH